MAAAVLLAVTGLFVRKVRSRCGTARGSGRIAGRRGLRRLWRERPEVRRVLVANALWETALNGLRAFAMASGTLG